jgi:hypothetical protein
MSKSKLIKKRKQHQTKKTREGMKQQSKITKPKKVKRLSINDPGFQLDYVEMKDPMEGLSINERRQLFKRIGETHSQLFQTNLNKLKRLIENYEIVNLLSYYSMYNLTVSAGETLPEDDDRLFQYHIELLQALALQRNSLNKSELLHLPPSDTVEIETLIREISTSFHFQRFREIDPDSDEVEYNKFAVIESIRNRTAIVRNWGYPSQIIRITKGLFSSIDKKFETKYKISISDILDLLISIQVQLNNKLNAYREKTRMILNAKTKDEVLNIFLNQWPNFQLSNAELKEQTKDIKSVKDLKWGLINYSHMYLDEIYSFSIENIFETVNHTKIPMESISQMLDLLSIETGGLRSYETEFIFLANPIWKRPLIQINKNKYAWPIPGVILEYCIDMLENIVSKTPELYSDYEKERGPYLELQIENMFRNAFPHEYIYSGSLWFDIEEKKEFENDLLIIIDSFAIVVEAKSGKISDVAKRGGSKRLEREIQKLLIDPSIQARRFSKYLKDQKNLIEFDTRHGNKNQIDLSNVREILTLGITLENFSSLSSNQYRLFKAGFIKDSDNISINMSLSDLEIVFDLLETSCEKIHYLIRREHFEKEAEYEADELDLLVFYLKTGFNIGEYEFNKTKLMIGTESFDLDPYYINKFSIWENSKQVPKPLPRRTTWWNDIIHRLDNNKIKGWTEIANILLNLSYEDQKDFEKGVEKIKGNLKSYSGRGQMDNMVIMSVGPQQRKELLIGLVYKDISNTERNKLIESNVLDILNKEGLQRAAVIAIDINMIQYPYTMLAVLESFK